MANEIVEDVFLKAFFVLSNKVIRFFLIIYCFPQSCIESCKLFLESLESQILSVNNCLFFLKIPCFFKSQEKTGVFKVNGGGVRIGRDVDAKAKGRLMPKMVVLADAAEKVLEGVALGRV